MAAMVVSTLPLAARILVWIIVLVPLGIFIWRRMQGIPLRGPGPDGQPRPTRASRRRALQHPDPAEPPAMPLPMFPAGPGADQPGVAPVAPVTLDPGVAPPAAIPDATRGGFFAAAPSQAESGPAPAPDAARATVAEAVAGISMPAGLSPVPDVASRVPNPYRVAFLTDQAPAPEVGRALADELERLGFTLSTPAPTELLARRPGVELRVVLHPRAASAKRGIDLLFPAAAPDAVGVELST
jgi:hypothetical protein